MYEMINKKEQKNYKTQKSKDLCQPIIQCSRWPRWMRFATLGVLDPFRYLPSCLGGYGPYKNKLAGNFDQEFDDASKGIQQGDFGPIMISDPRLAAFLLNNNQFKWIYDKKDGIILIESQYKHSIAAAAGDIITGGSGKCLGAGRIELNNDTGHYQTDFGSLALAKAEWERNGFLVTLRDRPQLPRMFGGD